MTDFKRFLQLYKDIGLEIPERNTDNWRCTHWYKEMGQYVIVLSAEDDRRGLTGYAGFETCIYFDEETEQFKQQDIYE